MEHGSQCFIWSGVLKPSYGAGFSILHMERGSQSFIWSGDLNPSFGAGFSILHFELGSQSFIWSGVLNPLFGALYSIIFSEQCIQSVIQGGLTSPSSLQISCELNSCLKNIKSQFHKKKLLIKLILQTFDSGHLLSDQLTAF